MIITATEVNALGRTPKGQLFQFQSSNGASAGQYLSSDKQPISILQCYQTAEQFQWLVHVESDAVIVSGQQLILHGKAVEINLSEPSYILCEGMGIGIFLHWLDCYRQTVGENQARKFCHRVFFYETEAFFFTPTPSEILTPELPDNMIAAIPLLDDLGIPSRLCCGKFRPGCFEGDLTLLAEELSTQIPWLGLVENKTVQSLNEKLGEAAQLLDISKSI